MLERVRTDRVIVGLYSHAPGDQATAVEWWEEPSIAFTTFGACQIRSGRGQGDLTPGTVLVSAAGAEHECRHPCGVTDRMLVVMYRRDVDPGPRLVVPQAAALHSVRRSLVAELRANGPDRSEVEALSSVLIEKVREAPGGILQPAGRFLEVAHRLRAWADARYREPDLDLVAEAVASGMSRTRFIHVFRDVVGVTPHRYVLELRTSHAARLLLDTSMPVTDICFDSGFGSMPSFHGAFRAAYGTTPSAFRAAHGGPHFSCSS